MFKGGRPKDPVWDHFHRVTEGAKTSAQCKKCHHIMANRVERMKAHRSKCFQTATLKSSDRQSTSVPDTNAAPELGHEASFTSLSAATSNKCPMGPAVPVPPPKRVQSDLVQSCDQNQ